MAGVKRFAIYFLPVIKLYLPGNNEAGTSARAEPREQNVLYPPMKGCLTKPIHVYLDRRIMAGTVVFIICGEDSICLEHG